MIAVDAFLFGSTTAEKLAAMVPYPLMPENRIRVVWAFRRLSHHVTTAQNLIHTYSIEEFSSPDLTLLPFILLQRAAFAFRLLIVSDEVFCMMHNGR